MKKLVTAAIAAIFVFGAAGCSDDEPSPEPKQEVSDAEFVDGIREETDFFDVWQDDSIVTLAKETCEAFDRGVEPAEIRKILTDGGVPQYDAGFIIGGGTHVYCIEHMDEVNDYANIE